MTETRPAGTRWRPATWWRLPASGPRRMRPVQYAGVTVAVVLACLVPSLVTNSYWLGICVTALIFAIAASSLNLVSGYLGETPLVHQAFFAVGAYTSTLVSVHFGVTPLVGVASAVLGTAVTGVVIGAISFRAVGATFAIATFGFAQLISILIEGWDSLTRGVLGIGSPALAGTVAGVTYDFSTPESYYYVALVALLCTLGIIALFLRRRPGRAAVAIREHSDLAASLGIPVYRTRVMVFTLSAALAGLSGALYAHYIKYISSGVSELYYLVAFLIMVVFGGNGTLLGPVLGAFFFVLVPELLRVTEQSRLLLFALFLLAIIMISPRGALPGLKSLTLWLYGRLRRRRRDQPPSDPSEGPAPPEPTRSPAPVGRHDA
jgi:branched-chain amino acid transport system permease protein